MDRPLLSICIPTYNRAEKLSKLLDGIIFQVKSQNFDQEVEIVISDNASNDSTHEIVEAKTNDFSNIKYCRNSENLGPENNGANTFEMATGYFCWCMSDKRRLNNGALEYVIKNIKNHFNVPCIIIDLSASKDQIKLLRNGSDILGGPLGCDMSTCIFKKDNMPADYKKYIGTMWLHYAILLEMTAPNNILVIGNVIDMDKVDKTCRWAIGGGAFFSQINSVRIFKNLPSLGYSYCDVKVILNRMAKDLPTIVSSARIYGLPFSFSHIKSIYREYGFDIFHCIIASMVFFIPVPFLKLAKIIKNKWKSYRYE